MRPFDVVIVGAGMAGSLLARQLRRTDPSMSVALLEKASTPKRKVGESTVDVCGKYLTKRLGLSTYLYDRQLPKNGLRFFFDRADRSGSMEELSEIGSTGLLPLPSFQLDRARFEADLHTMNEESGIDVRTGVRVHAIALGEGEPHAIAIDGGETLRARWVVDATGRSSRLARQLDVRTPVDTVQRVAGWARFEGVADLDDFGSPAFRARVRDTSRVLSTNHFCYAGYWIWLIPLGEGITSVGVVADRGRVPEGAIRRDGLVPFLLEHRAMRELLGDARALDHGSLDGLAYGTTRTIDVDRRVALIGEAAAFTDPLYSPGGDFIALANDWVSDVIARESAGEPHVALQERASIYERLFLARHEATLLLHQDQYDVLGSFELFGSKWDFDLACYLNLWVEPYWRDEHLDLDQARVECAGRAQTLGVLSTFRHVFVDACATLRERGRYFERNVGHAVLDPAARFLFSDFGTEASRRRGLVRVREAMHLVLDELNDKLGRPRADVKVPFAELALGRRLVRY
ncbi:MAG: NAD(P)/FAD-dependent oxidoreductase [Sandaracinaceae bacterium]